MAAAVDADEAGAARGGVGGRRSWRSMAARARGRARHRRRSAARGCAAARRRDRSASARGWRGRRRPDRSALAESGGLNAPMKRGEQRAGRRASRSCCRAMRESGAQPAALPPNRPAGWGSMSTTMIRPARAGRRAAIIIASVPPIEWPTIAGRSSRARRYSGQSRRPAARRPGRPGCRAPARRRSPRPGPDDSDSRASRLRSRARPRGPTVEARDQDHVGAAARAPRPRSGSARSAARRRRAGATASAAAQSRKCAAVHRACSSADKFERCLTFV